MTPLVRDYSLQESGRQLERWSLSSAACFCNAKSHCCVSRLESNDQSRESLPSMATEDVYRIGHQAAPSGSGRAASSHVAVRVLRWTRRIVRRARGTSAWLARRRLEASAASKVRPGFTDHPGSSAMPLSWHANEIPAGARSAPRMCCCCSCTSCSLLPRCANRCRGIRLAARDARRPNGGPSVASAVFVPRLGAIVLPCEAPYGTRPGATDARAASARASYFMNPLFLRRPR